jgi:hypothetical protein
MEKMRLTTRQMQRSEVATLLGIDFPPQRSFNERPTIIKQVVHAQHPLQALEGSLDLVDVLLGIKQSPMTDTPQYIKTIIAQRLDPTKYRSLVKYNTDSSKTGYKPISYLLSKEDVLLLWHSCSLTRENVVLGTKIFISWADPPPYKEGAWQHKRPYDQVH